MLTRRSLLASLPIWTFAVSTGVLVSVPRRAHADPSIILAVVAITSAIVSLFNRSNVLADNMAVLNAKLDAIIDLQRLTFESLQLISSQIKKLSDELDQVMINQTLRENMGQMSGLLENLHTLVTEVMSGPEVLADDDLVRIDERTLSELCNRAVQYTADLSGHLQFSTPETDRGLKTLRYASISALLAQSLVPTMKSIDDVILDRTGRVQSRRSEYRQILQSLHTSSSQIAEVFGPSQRSHELQVLGSIQFNFHESNWIERLSLLDRQEDWSADVSFSNTQAFGPCTHQATHGIEWSWEARRFIRIMQLQGFPPWHNYRTTVSGRVSGRAALVEGKFIGSFGLSWVQSAVGYELVNRWSYDNPNWGPFMYEGEGPFLPMSKFQFFCPGRTGPDIVHGPVGLWEDLYASEFESDLASFFAKIDEVTLRKLNLLAIDEVERWARSAVELVAVSELALG